MCMHTVDTKHIQSTNYKNRSEKNIMEATTTTSTSSSASGSRRKQRYVNISGDHIARAKQKLRN